ncbi:unnamed protein product [Schistocephalus solidus]|uniref:TPR_REGION domain-containing protein n=1 Tax=Schistocephalus solidus TaxID=70667 RepID=A0A183SGB8_SCHSO|nr:unnamed protein product [Schistocephalus solidus]
MDTDCSSNMEFQIRQDLVSSIAKCQIRGLVQSAAWLSELLSALAPLSFAPLPEPTLADFLMKEYSTLKSGEQIVFTLAKTYFDTQEYFRCAHLLSSHIASRQPILYFLYAYARYMAVEKHKTDDALSERKYWNWSTNSEPPENYESYRRALSDLKSDMEYFFMPSQQVTEKNLESFLSSGIDGYTAYIYALVRNRLGFQSMAVRVLTYVVKKDPTMWPAWSELILLLEDREQLDLLFPTTSCSTEWLKEFFRAKALLRLQEAERALSILQELESKGFRNSLNLQADIAEAFDRLRDLDSAMERFKQLFSVDPYRLTDTDVYSNVLFVKGEHNELAYLARRCAEIDKYRPQTCCVLGNFYGLRGQHDKAVVYFQRALRLQPRYALVWTLIGHEYVELRHLKLATHAYNQAIIHNRHDHRAWYGLGQLYEFVKQPEHALYYYKYVFSLFISRAQYLCHTDSRIIVALGEMYEALGNLNAAKKCFWRAYSVGDLEGGALNNLARCFAKCGEESETAAAYTQFIHQCNSRGVSNEAELGQAYRYLANYHLQHKHYHDAVIAVNKCLDFPEIREEAKALCLQLTLLSGSTNTCGSAQPLTATKTTPTVDQQLSDRGTGDYELETEEEEKRDDGMTAGKLHLSVPLTVGLFELVLSQPLVCLLYCVFL